ncbi:MAG: thiamine pyrophosphate-dependent enzyme [Dysosmobacter sp.]|uniref:thiamine pyrophosphate-dependent enzyme n=1 Tax=Dysosmobacter sp. TaxID=2591382 RepID=UPI0028452375|nr:thiamine pyrophosphate-dependent enzyme [Dysosmobacter sp.]MDR3983975.1 thiamine pyrophosphate-dependent enzyme [Dysosmobacter sp.]
MAVIYQKSAYLNDVKRHYCPGCSHGIAHKIVGEVLEEMGLLEKTIMVAPVGCSGLLYDYSNTDGIHALHGRAPAVATGVKAVHPDKIVYAYQGDGDLISIGTGETVSAAARGENITVIFANNSIFGMTGGQMAGTTLVGEKTSTCRDGRNPQVDGYPVGVCEMLAPLQGAKYIARASLHDVPHILKAKQMIRTAFEYQLNNRGYSLVELLCACPTNLKMSPTDACRWVGEEMTKTFPLGVFKEE